MTVDASEHIKLPPHEVLPVPVKLPDDVRALYRELENEFLAEFYGDTIAINNAAALSGKLLQVTSGAHYPDPESREWVALHSAKLDALEGVAERADGPLLVAYNFRFDPERIMRRFPDAVLLDNDPATQDAWNAGEIDMLLAHPASAGHGLNLQFGGNNLAWYGLNWSLELVLQFNARLGRQGCGFDTIYNHVIAAEDTIDNTLLSRLGEKDTTQRALLEATKRDMESRQ